MSRITEIDTQDETEVVHRIIAQVHKVLDNEFPNSRGSRSRKFTTTEFSSNVEDTVVDRHPQSTPPPPAQGSSGGLPADQRVDLAQSDSPPVATPIMSTSESKTKPSPKEASPSASVFTKFDDYEVTGRDLEPISQGLENERNILGQARGFSWKRVLIAIVMIAATVAAAMAWLELQMGS